MPHYHLLVSKGTRIQYSVNYSAYISTLAQDFGGAPNLLQLYQHHGLPILLMYCFGISFITFYRLLGPFKSLDTLKIARIELAETVLRRGIIGNYLFAVLPIIFYRILNAIAYLLDICTFITEEEGVQ